MLGLGFEVEMVVSDRAKALIQVCDTAYLKAVSMPDLFHFTQDCLHLTGLKLGKMQVQAQKKLSEAECLVGDVGKKAILIAELTVKLTKIREISTLHRTEIENINQSIHPFDSQDDWSHSNTITKSLTESMRQMCYLGTQVGIEADLDKIQKVHHQIQPIATAVEAWVAQTKAHIDIWARQQALDASQQEWFIKTILPMCYWEQQLQRTQANTVNKALRQTYTTRLDIAKKRYDNHPITLHNSTEFIELCLLKGQQYVSRFHRSSSKVEGRNGYLSFMQHAQKGMNPDRQKILTIVHNFDTRDKDRKTPAEKLFNKQFPDLFEFICQNVTGFKEPRKYKHN